MIPTKTGNQRRTSKNLIGKLMADQGSQESHRARKELAQEFAESTRACGVVG